MRRLSELHLPWRIPLVRRPRRPLIAYSDASYEPDTMACPRLGWIVFDPEADGKHVVAATLDVPLEVIECWKQRKQQIFSAEAFDPLTATWDCAALRERDVIWFVDNEAAVATLIRGASTQGDVQAIVEASHLLWSLRRLRVWIEWIDSDSNPSDGLSRDGLICSWCAKHGITLTLAKPPPWSSPQTLVDVLLTVLPES